ncbi:MAG: hypothetical protein FJ306_15365 [Planctomycetes bacterium]|nr:hypothetical protein [Planctomycetota bacterium]
MGPNDPDDVGARHTGDLAGDGDQPDALAEQADAGGGGAAQPSASASVVVQDALPDTMFVFPLRKAAPFPHLMMPLLLDQPAAREIVAKAEAHNGYLFLVLQKDPEQEVPGPDGVHEVGVITRILRTLKLPDGSTSAMTHGMRRARIVKLVREAPHMVARVKELVEIPAQGAPDHCSGCCRSSYRRLPNCRSRAMPASPRRCSTSTIRASSPTSPLASCARSPTGSDCSTRSTSRSGSNWRYSWRWPRASSSRSTRRSSARSATRPRRRRRTTSCASSSRASAANSARRRTRARSNSTAWRRRWPRPSCPRPRKSVCARS